MIGDNYYLLATLPPLDPPGSPPPVPLAQLMARLSGRGAELAGVIILSDDLLQREAALSGELERPEPAVLTLEQATGKASLPGELEAPPSRVEASTIPSDAVWRGYFFHAAAVAGRTGSRFVREWVGYQVGVRNALAAARARTLGLDRSRFRVARALERRSAEVDTAVDLWGAADDPLRAIQALIGAEWRWIEHVEPRYTFQDDEFAAYAAKLVLVHRWHRIETGPGERDNGETAEAA
jgi:hypothetical protein